MNDHSLRVLEFAAIRERLMALAQCSLGAERAQEHAPSIREDEVIVWQTQTSEAVRLLEGSGGPPFGGIHDIRPALQAARAAGMLDPSGLLAVADTISGTRKLKTFLVQRHEAAPTLAALARFLDEHPSVEQAIYEAISEQGEVRDDASPMLLRVRKEMRVVRQRMLDRLHSTLRSSTHKDMIQEPIVTTRDGRYCIPVKAEYRVQFGGLVHDQSASGATVFMEPAAVVELGNELRQLEIRERQEVERILRQLTGQVGQVADPLQENVRLLGELDFIFMRARLGRSMDAVPPEINRHGFVALRRARHPLLTGEVVPVDVELGREHTVLVVTGPNTGGKTVALKTVGLLALMAQSGLHVPAHEGTTLPVFRGIYADIGDEQSIAQSLSTFSGHITNIAGILKQVEITGKQSLVLLDEVGAGTDPTEGAALAKAILQYLLQSGARTIGTTHYGELKEFAYSNAGVENASVEFNLETLRPTYRLLTGIPGASNAFAIAARLGLPEEVLNDARGLIGSDQAVLSDVIQRLTENQRATESDLRSAAQAARDVEQKRAEYDRRLQALRTEQSETLTRAKAEAAEIVRVARREMESMRGELRRLERQIQRAATEGATPTALQEMRERLTRASQRFERRADRATRANPRAPREVETPVEPPVPVDKSATPAVGDLVWVGGLNQRGTLLTLEGDRAQVQFGSMRMAVPIDTVQRILTPKPGAGGGPRVVTPAGPARSSGASNSSGGDVGMRVRASISPEIRLLGLRAEEALTKLEEYVDQACIAGLSPFRVVHGKGTGALRKVVWEYLKAHPNIASFRHPPDEEGGSGATIAELRE